MDGWGQHRGKNKNLRPLSRSVGNIDNLDEIDAVQFEELEYRDSY